MSLLKRYFTHLSLMASETIPEDGVEDINTLVGDMASIGIDVSHATIGGKQVSSLIPKVTTYLVAKRQNKLLETELRERSASILEELGVQQAYLSALKLQMEKDIKVLADSRVFTDVAAPFISNSVLPTDWAELRRNVHSTRVTSNAAGNAVVASKKLKSIFIELIEGKSSAGKFAETMQSINKILDIVDVINSSS